MKVMKMVLDKSALDKLLEGNLELELDVRKAAENTLKDLINTASPKIKQAANQLFSELIGAESYNGFQLTEKAKAAIRVVASEQARVMFAEESTKLQAMIDKAVDNEVINRISKGVDARLRAISKQLEPSEEA